MRDYRSGVTRAVAVAAIALLAGCGSAALPPDGADPTASPAPTGASHDLAALARAGLGASYVATYTLTTSEPPLTGTADVYRTPTAVRLDLHAGGDTKQVYVLPSGTVSCTDGGSGPACQQLAPAGSPPPPAQDPGLQHVFSDDLAALASGAGISVRDAGKRAAGADVPASQCFAITSVPSGSALVPGTLCFSAGGVLTSATFGHSAMEATSVGGAPAPSDLELPGAD